jgi:excisionase family DNA binding protein
MATIARNQDLLHVKEAARLLDVHPSSLRRAIASGSLSALRLGPTGHYRIRREALDEFLKPHTPAPKEAA